VSTENLTREECATRSKTVSVKNYEIHLDLTDVANSANFGSVTRVAFTATPGSSTWIDLIAPELVSATLNGVAIDSSAFDGTRLQLTGLKDENVLEVTANCAYSNTGEGLHKFTDPADNEIYLYSQFEIADARRVFACFDQPNLKATYEFTVDAPAHYVAHHVGVPQKTAPQDGGYVDALGCFSHGGHRFFEPPAIEQTETGG
jgi:aminopeptidase N